MSLKKGIYANGDEEIMSIYDTHDIAEIREHFTWARRYDQHDQLLAEVEWILLKDISDNHLSSLMAYAKDRTKMMRDIFCREEEYRQLCLQKVSDYD